MSDGEVGVRVVACAGWVLAGSLLLVPSVYQIVLHLLAIVGFGFLATSFASSPQIGTASPLAPQRVLPFFSPQEWLGWLAPLAQISKREKPETKSTTESKSEQKIT